MACADGCGRRRAAPTGALPSGGGLQWPAPGWTRLLARSAACCRRPGRSRLRRRPRWRRCPARRRASWPTTSASRWWRSARAWPAPVARKGRRALRKRCDLVTWRLITYRLPAEPSRHRVGVWRELRRLGAVSLQQGTWAVPEGEGFDAGFAQVVEAITA